MIPANGVNPIEVLIDFPSLTAVKEPPAPKCATMILECSG